MANFTYRHIGTDSNSNEDETKRFLKEHGLKGIRALRQQFNVECFEDITPTSYFVNKSVGDKNKV